MSRQKRMSIVIGLILSACIPLAASGAGLQPIDRIYDFGEVAIDFHVFHEFTLLNRSSRPIHLDSVKVACDCSAIWVMDSTVNPGDTARIGLDFSTKDYYGRTSKAIKVYCDDTATPTQELFYLSTVGQWYLGLKPDPISLFFLPGRDSVALVIPNPALNEIEIDSIDAYGDMVKTQVVQDKAARGGKLHLTVSPRAGLTKGTYHTSLRIAVKVFGIDDVIYKTIPAKIVRY